MDPRNIKPFMKTVHTMHIWQTAGIKDRLAVKMTTLRYKTNFHGVNGDFPAKLRYYSTRIANLGNRVISG